MLKIIWYPSQFSPFLYSPFSNRSFKAVVVYTNLYQSLAFCRIRNKITLVVDLFQGSVGRTVILQLYHVYGVWQVQHGICSAYCATFLHLDIGSHKIEDEIEHGLEVALVLFLISCISIALWFCNFVVKLQINGRTCNFIFRFLLISQAKQ